jgi:hypothetical protein
MRFLELVRRYPVALLAVVALAFVSWVWWDALPGDSQPALQHADSKHLTSAEGLAVALDDTFLPPAGAPLVKVLPMLKPGMTRAEVERLVGAPTGDIYPATVAGDRVTYHIEYGSDFDAEFGAARTVRPIRPMPKPAGGSVTLEYDATRPGHPLVAIHYTDPLF